VVLYVGEKDGERLKDFWIWELDAQNRVKRFARAESGLLDYSNENNTLVLTLERAQVEVRDTKDPENFSKHSISPGSDVLPIDLPVSRLAGDRSVKRKPKLLTFPQLMAEWTRLQQPDESVTTEEREKQLMRVQITIQEKASMAFAVLSFALMAIPLGIKISRKETSANLGIGLLLAMGYYFATIMAGWLDNSPALRPDLIVWIPNILFQSIGLWLFYRVDRS
jgi:lipopolysaccharide export system permease protein